MMDAGVFYGRKKSKTNPKMRGYILGNRGGIEIINLEKTEEQMDLAAAFIPGRAGGLPSASRSIVGAYVSDGGSPETAAKAAAARLRELAWTVSG